MEKPKFILRRTVNRIIRTGRPEEYVTWDVMRKWRDGEEFVCEFKDEDAKLAAKAVKALNKP